jgi:redox-sensing transcriptional repressor
MPYYLEYLKNRASADGWISASTIANDLRLYEVLVRKDLAFVSSVSGKPRVGFKIDELTRDIEHFLGYDIMNRAVLVGAGHLGKALMCYQRFEDYGLEIVAAFDSDKKLSGKEVNGKTIFHIGKLENLIGRLSARIGIITVPAGAAREVCDLLIKNGITAIWNFAPTQLNVPENIHVQNENMAESLAILSKRLTDNRR